MTDLLAEAASWLTGKSLECLSERILWIPRGGVSRELDAVVGRTVFRAEDGYGMVVRTESRDFIVRAEDMPEEPRRGDSVVWKGAVYEVLAPNGEPAWRWSDGHHSSRRIHTKECGETENEEEGNGG